MCKGAVPARVVAQHVLVVVAEVGVRVGVAHSAIARTGAIGAPVRDVGLLKADPVETGEDVGICRCSPSNVQSLVKPSQGMPMHLNNQHGAC
jgi:hypothetical protein